MEMQNVKDQVTKVFTPARLKKAAALAVLVGIVSAGGAYYHHCRVEARAAAEKQARTEMIAAQAEQRGIVLLDEAKVRSIAAEAIGKSETELDFRSVYLTEKEHDRDGKHDKRHRDGKHGDKHDDRRDGKHDGKHDKRNDDREHRDGRSMHERGGQPGMMPQPPAPMANSGNGQSVPPAPAQAANAENGQPAPKADAAVSAPPAPMTDGTASAPPAPPMNAMPQGGPQPMFHPAYKVKCYAGSVEYELRIDAVTGAVLSSEVDTDDRLFS